MGNHDRPKPKKGFIVLATLLVFILSACASTPPPHPIPDLVERDAIKGQAVTGTQLRDGLALYPRVVRIENGEDAGTIVASVVAFSGSNGLAKIFHSTDEGTTFTEVGEIRDQDARKGLCCGVIYELPQAVGEFDAGTLLWSASAGADAGADRRMVLPLWSSTDAGRTWQQQPPIVTAPNSGGIWEPEFAVTSDGRLAVYFADETEQPTYSQTLQLMTSSDLVSWDAPAPVVAATDPALRPGMPMVRRLPDESYLMTYEVCAQILGNCEQRWRTSEDGLDWGDPTDLGSTLIAEDGTHFRHAPTLAWYDDGTSDGRLLTVGQMLFKGEEVAEGNGSRIFVNEGDPSGPWTPAQAPVSVKDPWDNFCPNYSSPLLPLPESGRLLQLASAYGHQDNTCTVYFAVTALPE